MSKRVGRCFRLLGPMFILFLLFFPARCLSLEHNLNANEKKRELILCRIFVSFIFCESKIKNNTNTCNKKPIIRGEKGRKISKIVNAVLKLRFPFLFLVPSAVLVMFGLTALPKKYFRYNRIACVCVCVLLIRCVRAAVCIAEHRALYCLLIRMKCTPKLQTEHRFAQASKQVSMRKPMKWKHRHHYNIVFAHTEPSQIDTT